MTAELDIVIPVHNEGRNIVATLAALAAAVRTPSRVLICYDHPDDDTLPAVRDNAQAYAGLPVDLVRNQGTRCAQRGDDGICRERRAVHPRCIPPMTTPMPACSTA